MVLGFLQRWEDVYRDAVSSSSRRLIIADNDSLAMAEMTTLVAAIYRKYTTATTRGFDKVSPGVTARYEIFYDESCSGMRVSLLQYVLGVNADQTRSTNVGSSLRLSHDTLNAKIFRHIGPLKIILWALFS